MNLRRLVITGTVTVLFIANLAVWISAVSARNKELLVKVYDVGQGDSIFIRTPDNYKILVDGGPTNKIINHLNSELGLNDRTIDLVVLTHPQSDHMFGLIEVLKQFQVKKVITSNVSNSTTTYQLWRDTLKNSQLVPVFVHAGESITLSDQVTLKFIWPKELKPVVADLNQAAVVMKLSYGNFDMLLTADADMKAQPYTSSVGHIEVLKVPHHGSRTAVREDYLRQLKPDVSVVSVGERNSYGHPNSTLLNLLLKNSKKVYRTDQNGTVEFVSNGATWYTQLEKGN